jgi:hypothetical protein
MADLSLDLITDDLLIINNDLSFTSDIQPAGTNNVLQDILQRMRFFYGEWFLDNTEGVQYYEQILVKNPDISKIDVIFIELILSTRGIDSLDDYSFSPNFEKRKLGIKFKATSTNGPIDYSGTFVAGG